MIDVLLGCLSYYLYGLGLGGGIFTALYIYHKLEGDDGDER